MWNKSEGLWYVMLDGAVFATFDRADLAEYRFKDILAAHPNKTVELVRVNASNCPEIMDNSCFDTRGYSLLDEDGEPLAKLDHHW